MQLQSSCQVVPSSGHYSNCGKPALQTQRLATWSFYWYRWQFSRSSLRVLRREELASVGPLALRNVLFHSISSASIFPSNFLNLEHAIPASIRPSEGHTNIDGQLYFHDEEDGRTRQIILSVKAGAWDVTVSRPSLAWAGFIEVHPCRRSRPGKRKTGRLVTCARLMRR